jgi:MFS family permease
VSLAKLTRNYLGFQVTFALLFWLPVFYEIQKKLGISDSEIFWIQSFYYLLFCILELPTGWLADRFGSIRTLRAGAIALVLAQLVIVWRGSWFSAFHAFLIHFILIAVARSLVSGASNAYLYEAYVEAGRGSEYVHVEGRARAYGLFAKIACWSVVGFLTERSLLSSYWLTLNAAILAVGFGFMLPERNKTIKSATPHLGHALSAIRSEPRLLGLMVQGMGVFVLARIVQVNLFQPLMLSRGFSLSSLGCLMAIMTASEALASMKLAPVLKRISPERSVSLLTGVVAVSVAALSISWQGALDWVNLGLLVLFSAGLGFVGPIQRQVINQGISNSSEGVRLRATLLSFESLLDRAVCSAVVAAMGPWVQEGRLDRILLTSGLVFFVIAAFQFYEGTLKAKLKRKIS